jgi:hypothetical protein
MATTDPVAAVRQYIDAFNKGDEKGMTATFTVPGSILDGMAPHVWQGPTASQDWYRDVLIEAKQHDASDYFVTLGEPLHNRTTGESAYVVVPRDHDVQSTRPTGYAARRDLYGRASQARRRVANHGLGVDKRS